MFNPLIYTLKTNKAAVAILLLAVAGLLSFTFPSIIESREDLSGTYVLREDGRHTGYTFRLDIETDEGQLNGLMQISDKDYLVTAKQDEPGKIEGHYHIGDRNIPFQLEANNFFLPFFYTLNSKQHSLSLMRANALPEDLTGTWVSLYGKLKVQRDEDGGWQGLLTSADNKRTLLEFNTKGLRLSGAYRHEGRVHPLEGKLKVAGQDRIDMQVAGQSYEFVREDSPEEFSLSYSEVLPLYDGVFSGKDVTLSNAVRRVRRGNTNHWLCEGSFQTPDGEVPVIGCGPEGEKLWINYRRGGANSPDFGVAYLTKQGDDVVLSGFTVNGVLKRVTPALTLGFYRANNLQLNLQQDAHTGDISGDLDFNNQRYRFRGVFEAGVLHCVGRDTNGQSIIFIVSETPKGVQFTPQDAKPITLEYQGITSAGTSS
jgi:hypothetical protein